MDDCCLAVVQGQKDGESMSEDCRRNRQIPNQSLIGVNSQNCTLMIETTYNLRYNKFGRVGVELVLFRLYSFARFTASFIDQKGGSTKVDTVVLLSKLHAKQHIEVKLNLNELDLTAAESKSTYEEVKEYVLEHTGLKVSHLYIAQVKKKYGIIDRANYNKPKSENSSQLKCPPEKEAAITEALKFFGMIK